jgi:hypothetical protein
MQQGKLVIFELNVLLRVLIWLYIRGNANHCCFKDNNKGQVQLFI